MSPGIICRYRVAVLACVWVYSVPLLDWPVGGPVARARRNGDCKSGYLWRNLLLILVLQSQKSQASAKTRGIYSPCAPVRRSGFN